MSVVFLGKMPKMTTDDERDERATHTVDRREFLALAACAMGVPGGAEFFRSWLAAGHAHDQQSGWQPPESALLRNYAPAFFDAADFAALQAFTEILIPTRRDPWRARGALRALHRFRAAGLTRGSAASLA